MDERIKEKLINRAKTNPYVNFLGIDFTVIEEGRVEAAELKMSFLRAAWGNELIAKGTVIKAGRNIHFCECEIYCDDKLVSKSSGTFCVVHPQV